MGNMTVAGVDPSKSATNFANSLVVFEFSSVILQIINKFLH